jgi:hypothetical protein
MQKSQKSFVIPLTVIVIILLIILSGEYTYKNHKFNSFDKSDIATTTATSTIVGNDRDTHDCIGSAGYSWCAEKNKCLRVWEEKCEAISIATTTNETANWETYKNNKYGFEFKYPTTILDTPYSDNSGILRIVFTNKLNKAIYDQQKLVPITEEPSGFPLGTIIYPDLYIYVVDKSQGRDLPDYSQTPGWYKFNFGGYTGFKAKEGIGGPNFIMSIKLPDGSYISDIEMNKSKIISCEKGLCGERLDDQQNKKLFDQIISTFKSIK